MTSPEYFYYVGSNHTRLDDKTLQIVEHVIIKTYIRHDYLAQRTMLLCYSILNTLFK